MSFLKRLFERKSATPSVTLDGVLTRTTGFPVTPGAVAGHSAVWSCINLISSSVSTMPLKIYRHQNGIMVEDANHPLNMLLGSPNFDQSPVDFWDCAIRSLEMRGSGLADIDRNDQGKPIALTPINFDRPPILRGACNRR